jgi:hypothetical protein
MMFDKALQCCYPNNSRREMRKVRFPKHQLLTGLTIHRPSSLDVTFVDFDNVRFHMSTPERKTVILLSMNIRCWNELAQYGANEVLRREYGSLVKDQPEQDHHVSLEIDLEQVPPEGGMEQLLSHLNLSDIYTHRGSRRVHQLYLSAETKCFGCTF